MMQIFDDWKLLNCDPYPPRGLRDRSEALAALFVIMKNSGYERSEIERKMLDPVIKVCVSQTMKDRALKKEITKSSEEAFRRGLAMAFSDGGAEFEDIELPEVPKYEYKKQEIPKYEPPKPKKYVPLNPEPSWADKFDFNAGGLLDDILSELGEEDEGNDNE